MAFWQQTTNQEQERKQERRRKKMRKKGNEKFQNDDKLQSLELITVHRKQRSKDQSIKQTQIPGTASGR
jgi:hypothetical protein